MKKYQKHVNKICEGTIGLWKGHDLSARYLQYVVKAKQMLGPGHVLHKNRKIFLPRFPNINLPY
jgi:hypothetical protein